MRLPSSSATKRSAEQNAESIRSQGVLSPLLVRPLTDQSFEIVAGARRYRAAQMAEAPTVPVRIVNLTDAEALEAQLTDSSMALPVGHQLDVDLPLPCQPNPAMRHAPI